MTRKRIGLIGFIFLSCLAGYLTLQTCRVTADPVSPQPAANIPAARTIAGFRLKDTDGRDVTLADFKAKKAIAVVFIGTECPLGNLYVLRLAELQRDFEARGVQVLAINSNSQDTPLELIDRVRPKVLVKGADYHPDEVIGREIVEADGGEVILVDIVPGHSTSDIVARSRQRVAT